MVGTKIGKSVLRQMEKSGSELPRACTKATAMHTMRSSLDKLQEYRSRVRKM